MTETATSDSGQISHPKRRDSLLDSRRSETVVIAGFLACVLAFLLWTASAYQDPLDFGKDYGDYYNLQSDALLSGRTSLEVKPPPGLLALPDPYDPIANQKYRAPVHGQPVHDLSLYHGRLYLYWGPTPAVTAFIPFRALGLGHLPQSLAVVLYGFVGLIFAIGVLRFLVRHYLPETPFWMQVAGIAALAFGSVLPFDVRRPEVYEVAINAGYCFFFAGLYLLLTGTMSERRSTWRVALASMMFGAAAGARSTYFVAGAAILAMFVILAWLRERRGAPVTSGRLGPGSDWRDSTSRIDSRMLVCLFVPFAFCVLLLALYNYARFDSLTEFGIRYQLAGSEVAKKAMFSLSYVLPGLWFYLIAPLRFALQFPFAFLPPPPGYPFALPHGYEGIEPTGGMLATSPIAVVTAALVMFRRRLTPRVAELARIAWALAILGLSLAILAAFTFWATTMRYEVDFASLLIMSGLLSWFAIVALARNRVRARRAAKIVGSVLISWGLLVGLAISIIGYTATIVLSTQYRTFEKLESITAPLPVLAAKLAGHPILTSVRIGPSFQGDPATNYATLDAGKPSFWIGQQPATLKIASNRSQTVELVTDLAQGPDAPHAQVYVVAKSSRGSTVRAVPPGPARSQRISIELAAGLKQVQLDVRLVSGGRQIVPPGPQILQVNKLIVQSASP